MRSAFLCLLATCCAAQTRPGLWERRAPFPIELTEVSSAALGDKVYSVCGLTAAGNSAELYIYDPRTDAWFRGAPIPIAGGADHCNVAAAGGKLYLLGAIRVGSSFIEGNTYEYDPAANSWRMVGRMGTPRGASGVATIGNQIFVAGGLAATGSVADFEVFDVATRTWSRLAPMPTARDHLTAQTMNGKVYAVAGRSDRDLAVNEEFDPATGQWRARAPLPRARGGLAGGAVAGRVIAFGGEGASGTPENTFNDNDEYDPGADSWRPLNLLPTPRHGFYGATLQGRVFAPGGGPRAGAFFSNAHEAFYYLPQWQPRFDGLRNSASYTAQVAPGSLASIFGADLSLGEQVITRLPAATQMNGVVVRIGGKPAGLVYVGPSQINVVVPPDLPPGRTNLELSNAGWTINPFAIELLEAAPGIFMLPASSAGAVLIAGTGLLAQLRAGGRPARKGEVLEIYCTGLGRLIDGRTATLPVVMIGGTPVEVLYSGSAPGAVEGLHQVNARISQQVRGGLSVPLVLRIGDRSSNTVTVTIAE